MQSLKYLYKIGRGPSSSHTMGPDKAARYFKNKYNDADSYKAILYGSLSSTGKGHKTDEAILDVFEGDDIELIFGSGETEGLPHENTMEFFALCFCCHLSNQGDLGTEVLACPPLFTPNPHTTQYFLSDP